MELSLKDRLILANQCRISGKALSRGEYAAYRAALEEGYQYEYDNPPGNYFSEMKSSDSEEVIGILNMHRALRFSYNSLEDKSGIDEKRIKFPGFDGKEEIKHFSYARYVCHESGERRFIELYDDKIPNSHSPQLDRYRAMLQEWQNQ